MQTPRIDTSRLVALAWQRAYGKAHDKTRPGWSRSERSDRAASDAVAAWLKWQACPENNLNAQAQRWYDILERARVETLASRELPGMAFNLQQVELIAPEGEDAARFYWAARALFGGGEWTDPLLPEPQLSQSSSQGILARFRARFSNKHARSSHLSVSRTTLTDAAARVILEQAGTCLSKPHSFSETVSPLVQWLAQHAPENTPESSGLSVGVQFHAEPAEPHSARANEAAGQENDRGKEGAASVMTTTTGFREWPGYAVYSRQWDEVRPAASYLTAVAHNAADLLAVPRRDQVRRLAHRLQRRLQAAQRRTWSFDQEEGFLDSRRLARLLAPGNGYTVFRQEAESALPDACVTLLVDQSGSMNAARRQMAALAIDLAAHTLETCRVSCEVLGFTTRYSADSPAIEAWRRAGSPAGPGRLNAIRHIVYKSAPQPWRRCRHALGLLLHEGFGRENIDGEALDWAATRLAARPEPRKILIVLSDGSPCDAATSQAHERLYLEDHLRQVIAAIEASPIHLAGLGAGREVGRFYRHALTLHHPDAVAEVLFKHLGDLLTCQHLGA